MTTDRSPEYLTGLVRELCKLPAETEWVEFKQNKVVFQTEIYQLPAPMFEALGENTRAVLFAHRPLTKMDKADRIRACYLHASLRYVNRDYMTNTTLRERFGIKPKNSAIASRLIKEALDAGAIRPYDEAAACKFMKYVPSWA